ncbi:MAG: bifunctional diguanylate cyclase/phosphodiesterase [Lachnospiraceae bacterium]|nr:bifunctional diguanylate cyclase/phosphodiesterase [Lachnospiraceae bacterium]
MLINFSMFALLVLSNNTLNTESSLKIGNMSLPIFSMNGVIQLVMFLGCILMTCISYKVGARLSYVVMILTMIYDLMGIMHTRSLGPLPGMINALLALAAIFVISKQFALLEKESVTDYVTGLYNMRGFLDELQERISRSTPFTVVYFRIDNFRMINDNLGHDMGTRLLSEVSSQLTDITKDLGTVCKIGGSEYALVLDAAFDVGILRKEMKKRFGGKVALEEGDFPVYCYPRVYAGAARFPEDALDASTLIKFADLALFHAMKAHANSLVSFDKEMGQEVLHQNELEGIVKECLAGDYFYLMYQPQYDTRSKELRGFETLLRTLLPDGTSAGPADFIPVAEKTNLIIDIDNYVLKRALTEMVDYISGYEQYVILSVNISANSISREDFADHVAQVLKETGFPADRLELEITEYSLAESESMTIENIGKLRKQGVKIALDDFGTGYTSLAQLVKLPINLLKIDKTLIDEIESSEKSRDFVNVVIYMGHLMDCDVISEGVESQMQVDLLREQNCDYVQGFVWDRPLYYEAAVAMLERGK